MSRRMGYAGLIPTAFAQAATGELTAEEALDQVHGEVRRIFQKRQHVNAWLLRAY